MRISDWSSDVCSSDLEAKERHPLINEKRFLGALHDPMEGHVDPAGVTQAYAKSARIAGAEIERFTRVLELHPLPDGGWEVVTDKGTLRAEHVVNCGGLWADRKSVVEGKSVSVRVDLGGRRIIKKKNIKETY